MIRIEIEAQTVAQGSYGLQRINLHNGVRIGGDTMRVWHVVINGDRTETFLTRREARHWARKVRADYKLNARK